MTNIMSFLQCTPGLLKVSEREESSSLNSLVDRMIEIAGLDETDLSTLMGTQEGAALLTFDVPESTIDPDHLLRDWDSIGRASPAELSASQYEQFLRGDVPATDPDVSPIQVYGLNPRQPPR